MSLERLEILTRQHFLISSSLLAQAEKLVESAPTETLRREAGERYQRLLSLHQDVEERYQRLWKSSSPEIKDENPPWAPLTRVEP